MVLVRLCATGLYASRFALWLSLNTQISTSLPPIDVFSCRKWTAYLVAYESAMYSASVDDSAIHVCFRQSQLLRQLSRLKRNPDFRSFPFPSQSDVKVLYPRRSRHVYFSSLRLHNVSVDKWIKLILKVGIKLYFYIISYKIFEEMPYQKLLPKATNSKIILPVYKFIKLFAI